METAKLSRNTHLGKFSLGARRRRRFAHLKRNLHRGSVKLSYDSHQRRWIGENIFSPLPSGEGQGEGFTEHQIRFAYDGNQIVLQFDKDGSGQLDASNLSHRYLWQPGAVDQLMSDERTHLDGNGNIATDEVLWALTDRQGSVNDLAKCDGGTTSVVDHIVRDRFGNVISESNPSQGCLIGWTGRPRDAVTGLQNNLNRWYDSRVAGWLSQDPIGFKSGTTNLYCYCGNSPTNLLDPAGTDTIPYEDWLDGLPRLNPDTRTLQGAIPDHVPGGLRDAETIRRLIGEAEESIRTRISDNEDRFGGGDARHNDRVKEERRWRDELKHRESQVKYDSNDGLLGLAAAGIAMAGGAVVEGAAVAGSAIGEALGILFAW
jgi:RHS repeat-associated protein